MPGGLGFLEYGTRAWIMSNPLSVYALAGRAELLKLERDNAQSIRLIFDKGAFNLAKAMRNLPAGVSPLTAEVMAEFEKQLTFEGFRVGYSLESRLRTDIELATIYGASGVQKPLAGLFTAADTAGKVTAAGLSQTFATTNRLAVIAQWSRTVNGLTLSDRIWNTAAGFRETFRDLINVSVASGLGAKDTAKLIDALGEGGMQLKRTVIKDYPKALARMGARSWPKNTNWEALRVARTELNFAYNQAAVMAGRNTPGYIGARWTLSNTHPEVDICDDYASRDEYGLGAGVYTNGNEPLFAHPNCLCSLIPVFMPREEFTDNLTKWVSGGKWPDMDKWYREVYKGVKR